MLAYEQRIEPPDRSWQYILFAAEPHETVSFKVRGTLLTGMIKILLGLQDWRSRLKHIQTCIEIWSVFTQPRVDLKLKENTLFK